jgi:hypothetical protein
MFIEAVQHQANLSPDEFAAIMQRNIQRLLGKA